MKTNNKKTALTLLIVMTALFGILLIPGIWVSAFSFMLFDAPGSTGSFFVVSLFISIVSFPVFVLLSFFSWLFFLLKKYKAAIIISLLPFVSLIAAGILFAVSELFFGGNLNP